MAQYDGEKEHDASLGRIPTSRLMRQDEPKLADQTPEIPPGLPHRQVSIFEAIKTGNAKYTHHQPSV